MIDGKRLLTDLRKLVIRLEADLEERRATHPETDIHLRAEYERARAAERTAYAYEEWRKEPLTQAAVGWVLSCVFVRFLEDNGLLDGETGPRRLLWGGRPELWTVAEDHYAGYVRANPSHSDRDFLLSLFEEVGRLPGAHELFDRRHNPVFSLGVTADGAKALRAVWQARDAATGNLIFDFSDSACDTRFLGDLYQDLSESVRKRYALLQTPDFVESFILDRVLSPAIDTFGFEAVRLIDPACGSGHFLLGAFDRLVELWRKERPSLPQAKIAQFALDAVHGVDINPYAVAIARFRLLVSALRVAGLGRLREAPDFSANVAAGDSLLHGPRSGLRTQDRQQFLLGEDPIGHLYESEDEVKLRRILGQRYHVVVANPPYITVKDPAVNQLYRSRFSTCHRQFSLVCPFLERAVDLALQPSNEKAMEAGWIGIITSNAFMKAEFGTKIVEEFLPKWDLTHVIDTSGAYIPGHGNPDGTPTAILLLRGRKPLLPTVRMVRGIRGEPARPHKLEQGLVWTAILRQCDMPGSQGEFISVSETDRSQLSEHPWSMGGGGVAELARFIEERCGARLLDRIDVIGRTTHTGEDEAFFLPHSAARALMISDCVIPLAVGEDVRDWAVTPSLVTVFPYDLASGAPLAEFPPAVERYFWPRRTTLRQRRDFGKTPEERGLSWSAHSMFFPERFRVPLSITYPYVATHNHFALDDGGKVFSQTAPAIKLPEGSSRDQHLELLGLLNSSIGCLWAREKLFPRGGFAAGKWEERLNWNSTRLQEFPIPSEGPLPTLVALTQQLDTLSREARALLPAAIVAGVAPTEESLSVAKSAATSIEHRMISLQEELDWHAYSVYGLIAEDLTVGSTEDLPEINLGERAFELVLARNVRAGKEDASWFERHESIPVTEIPLRWPESYRELVGRRLEAIEMNPRIALVERPEFKRRWAAASWNDQLQRALRDWLLDRIFSASCWPEAALQTAVRLCDRVRGDGVFRRVAELYTGRQDVNLEKLVGQLALEEAVPHLAAYRFSGEGLGKYEQWLRTWDSQRRSDAIDLRATLSPTDPLHLSPLGAIGLKEREIGEIPVPPKYGKEDFQKGTYWTLRGKLDVPKERFIHYPSAERSADPSPVLGWARWDHLQRAQALAQFYVEMRTNEGWPKERLVPLLAGLLELVPWLKQWHNEHDPAIGSGAGTYYAGFVESEARELGTTLEGLAAWRPDAKAPRGRKRK